MIEAGTSKQAELEALCEAHGARRLALFGSAAQGTWREGGSDLDFLVDIGDYDDRVGRRFVGFLAGLDRLFGDSIDVVSEAAVTSEAFRAELQRTAVTLYDRQDEELLSQQTLAALVMATCGVSRTTSCSGGGTMTDEVSDFARSDPAGELVGRFYARWRGDPLPTLDPVSGLITESCEDVLLVADVTGMDVGSVRKRMEHGNRPWLARIRDEPAGWGWVATREAGISELGIAITLSPGECYLWDFVTPPAWRGRGVYTSLLRAILERDEADRYWIGHDEGNTASARGIEKVGFRQVGTARRLGDGRIAFAPDGSSERADAAAELLGLPVVKD